MMVLYFISRETDASVSVAFFREETSRGRFSVYEVGGKYAHVAILVRGKWLHVYPGRDVEWVEHLNGMGKESVVLTNESAEEPTEPEIVRQIPRRYDQSFNWDSNDRTYCAKLVGELLHIAPLPMSFSSDDWSGMKNLPRGESGLSPDDIFTVLLQRGYRRTNRCAEWLKRE